MVVAFEQGKGFYEVDAPELDREGEWDETLAAFGLDPRSTEKIGQSDGFGEIIITQRSKGSKCPWSALVEFSNGSRVWLVLVKNIADELALLALLAPLVTACCINQLDEIQATVDKSFRALHGHDAHSACNQCDPHQAAREREFRQKRAAEKAAKP
jgi:hypothetical protein